MASAARQGPALRIEGSCEGCAHLRIQPRRDGPSRYYVTVCIYPSARGWIPIDATGTGKTTPARCPLLPAARLALARSVVAGSVPDGVFATALDLWEARDQESARGVVSVFCEPWLSLAEMHDRLKCEGAPAVSADECRAARGAGESEE